MIREKRFLTLLLLLVLLGCTILTTGCMTGEGPGTTTPVPTPPTFQPDILDKPIINAPPGEGGPSPFLFEFDTENASGFEAVRADRPGAPKLVLRPNASATLPIIVSSEAGTEIRITRTDGLPEGVQVSYAPDSFILKAGETTRVEMRLASSEDQTVPAETAVVVWMEGAGWEIGRGFHLGEME
ncbi:hypothetical protein [Methanofollis sp. UBA420]|jgi:hypothetical protein|uniref:hypothetical protein n=1 Tax=Methanofollis sp. UBA420 TaxID=1915514 RepID=UPI00316AC895